MGKFLFDKIGQGLRKFTHKSSQLFIFQHQNVLRVVFGDDLWLDFPFL
jgi:hypothetical protein